MKLLNNITISALLHDIGKIYQRAKVDIINDFDYGYCPKWNGKISHVHVAYTSQFISKNEELFKRDFFLTGDSEKSIVNLSAEHHKPSNTYSRIISIADWLSSGMERDEFDKYNTLSEDELKNQYNYKKSRLVSIFSRINLDSENKSKDEKFYKLEDLNPEILPGDLEENKTTKDAENEYRNLIEKFEYDLKKLKSIEFNSFDNFYNALSTLLERYLWCVPSSSYGVKANTSLYDHMRTTSAIATALYRYHEDKGDFSTLENYKSDEKKFILVLGDFSGIQDFIFSRFGESNRYAAKILRSKSFYVSFFTEMVGYLITKEFKTNSSSIIISAGGKIGLLLPKLKDYSGKLMRVKEIVNDHFYEKTFGQTKFNLASIEISGRTFTENGIMDGFKRLNTRLLKDKLRPQFKKPIFENYLEEVDKGGGVCEIDGYLPQEEGKEKKFSKFSSELIEIGKKLPKSDFLNIYFGDGGEYELIRGDRFKITYEISEEGNRNSDLTFKINPDENFTGYSEKMLAYYVPTFKKEDLNDKRYEIIDKKDIEGEEVKEGMVKTFYHIGADALKILKSEDGREKIVGKDFLAVLKADVDNLGYIFSRGLPKKSSIADYVSLSRMLDYFFTGWLPYKIREKYGSIYTVFAGGDDLFLIGPYTEIIELSEEISSHFKDYVAKNPEIHLSAGIVLRKPKVPVYQMADDAEEKLHSAKENEGKNSVNIFESTMGWKEYRELFKKSKEIDGLIEKYGISTSYLYKIFRFIEMSEDVKDGRIKFNKRKNAMWIPYLSYITKRNYRESADELIKFFYENIMNYGKKFVFPLSFSIYQKRS